MIFLKINGPLNINNDMKIILIFIYLFPLISFATEYHLFTSAGHISPNYNNLILTVY